MVSTNVGAISEILDSESGILVDNNDIDKLVESIDYVLSNYQSFDSENIRQKAIQQFSAETVLKQFDDFYDKSFAKYKN